MIKVKINYDGNVIKGFKVSGHANYDEYGKDIVCASVSTVVITSINLALKLDEKSVVVTDKPGLIEASILKRDDVINKIFINMKDMLVELQKDYSKNIKIL
jgi:uncharacterized protein YsxB (DUF464 family)